MFLLSVCLSVSRVTQKKLTNNVNFLEGACEVMDFGRYPNHVTLGLRLPALAEVCTSASLLCSYIMKAEMRHFHTSLLLTNFVFIKIVS